MTKKNLLTILIAAALAASPLTSQAMGTKEAALDLYNQLVTQDKSTGTTYIDDDVKTEEVIAEMVNIDSDETAYDGPYSIYKGTGFNVKTYNTGKMEVIIYNPFTREDSEKVLDKMVTDIDATLPENATQKDKLNAIIKYIGKTFTYDSGNEELIDLQNFVEAYEGDRKVVCSQYSIVTLLLCDRYGIDCRIMEGTGHAFNLIRLDGEDKYTAYDLTKTSLYLPAKVGYVDLITGNYTITKSASKYQVAYKMLTNKVPYRLSITILDVLVGSAFIGLLVIGIHNVLKTKRRSKKHTGQRVIKNRALVR